DVLVLPKERDQLISMKRLEVSVKLFPLFTGKVKVGNLNIADAAVTFIKRDSTSNYDFLFRSNPGDSTIKEEGPVNFAAFANRMINSILYKIPDDMILRMLKVSYQDDSLLQTISIPKADIDDGALSSVININDREAVWHVEGDLNTGRIQFFLRLFADEKKVEFPLLEKKY